MSEFKRKSSTSDFEVSESATPDFTALEAESGFSVDSDQASTGSSFKRAERTVEAEKPQPAASEDFESILEEPARPAASPLKPKESTPAKKRYYNPGEVMKKKGCIGCGGMALGLPILLTILALVMVIL